MAFLDLALDDAADHDAHVIVLFFAQRVAGGDPVPLCNLTLDRAPDTAYVPAELLDRALDDLGAGYWFRPELRTTEDVVGREDLVNYIGVYTLTPERIRRRTPEEMEEIERRRERERAERFRWVYGELELKVVVRKDGPLELSGVFGRYGTEPTPTPRSTPTSSAPR
jgi:hypothetical protein